MDRRTRESLELDALLGRIAERAHSRLGMAHIRALEPVYDLDEVEARLALVREIYRLFDTNRKLALGGIADLTELFQRAELEGSALSPEDWPQLRRHLELVESVSKFGVEHFEELPHLAAWCAQLHPNSELYHAINRVFDRDGLIRDDASPELARLRSGLRNAEQSLMRTINRIISSMRGRDVLQEEFATMRNGRHVVPVRSGARGRLPGIVHGSSGSGETVYVEPLEVVEAANDLELLREREAQEIHRLMLMLTALLRPFVPQAIDNLGVLGVLDGTVTIARVGYDGGWKIPVVGEGGALKLYTAHHPMLHLTRTSQSVPITIALSADDRTIVLSGPNAGGKTTAMKMLALSGILVQCGCPIPASPDSRLPLFRGFFADIGDSQDLGEGLSTFSGHIRRIGEILAAADDHSLVLLDELGTGTDPEEGGALAQALLEEFMRRAALTVVTSHLGPVKNWAEATTGARNASFSLDPSTQRPTFRLRLDIPGASEALTIAQNEGLPRGLLARARSLVGEQKLAMGELLHRIEQRERDLGAAVREAEARATSLEQQERSAMRRADELREERRILRAKALDEREKAVRQVRDRLEKMIAELPSEEQLLQRKKAIGDIRREVLGEERRIAGEQRDDRHQTRPMRPGELRPGKRVFIRAFNNWGEVLRVSSDGKRVTIVVGGVQAEVASHQLSDREPDPFMPALPGEKSSPPPGVADPDERRAGARQKKSRKVKTVLRELANKPEEPASRPRREPILGGSVRLNFRPEHVPLELDLHGYYVEEALAELDKYLDRALMADYPHVRIIHGTGQGKLYRAVHEFLRGYRAARKFRFANPDEGGGGVTIVEF